MHDERALFLLVSSRGLPQPWPFGAYSNIPLSLLFSPPPLPPPLIPYETPTYPLPLGLYLRPSSLQAAIALLDLQNKIHFGSSVQGLLSYCNCSIVLANPTATRPPTTPHSLCICITVAGRSFARFTIALSSSCKASSVCLY